MDAVDWMERYQIVAYIARRTPDEPHLAACTDCGPACGLMVMPFHTGGEARAWAESHTVIAHHAVELFQVTDGIPAAMGVVKPPRQTAASGRVAAADTTEPV